MCFFLLLFFFAFFYFFFFFNDTATTEIYTLSLHDALPISLEVVRDLHALREAVHTGSLNSADVDEHVFRSEEHTSELQSHSDLVCRLLLEKKKKNKLTEYNLKNKKIN